MPVTLFQRAELKLNRLTRPANRQRNRAAGPYPRLDKRRLEHSVKYLFHGSKWLELRQSYHDDKVCVLFEMSRPAVTHAGIDITDGFWPAYDWRGRYMRYGNDEDDRVMVSLQQFPDSTDVLVQVMFRPNDLHTLVPVVSRLLRANRLTEA